MKNFILIIISALFIFSSCDKAQVDTQANTASAVFSQTALFLPDVEDDLTKLGCTEVPLPPAYEPYFDVSTGYIDIKMFQNQDHIYTLYIWDNQNQIVNCEECECSHAWFSNGDCKEEGKECEVTIENGEVIIICCKEEPMA